MENNSGIPSISNKSLENLFDQATIDFENPEFENEIFGSLGKQVDAIAGEKGNTFWIINHEEIDQSKGFDLKNLQKEIIKLNKKDKTFSQDLNELYSSKKILPIHVGNEHKNGKRNVRAHPDIKEKIEKYGFDIIADNRTERIHPNELNFIAFSPEQLIKINNLAKNVFNQIKQNSKENNEEKIDLSKKTIVQLNDSKIFIESRRFPKLRELQKEAREKKETALMRKQEEKEIVEKHIKEKQREEVFKQHDDRFHDILKNDIEKGEIKTAEIKNSEKISILNKGTKE